LKILVTGAEGQLGNALRSESRLGFLGEVTWTGRRSGPYTTSLDLAWHGGTIERSLDALAPDVIVNAAAYTAVDKAEEEEAIAAAVNGNAVGTMGKWAAAHGALVIHVSTDYVFDGLSSSPYAIDAATSPRNAYGRSKLAGEIALQESAADFIILRTAWLYAAAGRNFMNTMLRLAADRDELRVVADQIGCPTPAASLASAIVDVIERWTMATTFDRARLRGIYHAVTHGHTSWYGFAEAIVEGAVKRGLISKRPRVVPIGTEDFPTPAPRPPYSVLDNSLFEATFARKFPTWENALSSTLDELIP